MKQYEIKNQRDTAFAEFSYSLIEQFAESQLENAYKEFYQKFQYDPRYAHDERIEFSDYGWSEDILQLEFAEQTLHDCPYYVSLFFNKKDLILIIKNDR